MKTEHSVSLLLGSVLDMTIRFHPLKLKPQRKKSALISISISIFVTVMLTSQQNKQISIDARRTKRVLTGCEVTTST